MAWFVGRRFFPQFMTTGEMLTQKNPSLYLIQNGFFPVYQFDSSVTAFLNTHLFNHMNVSIPEGYISLLWDSHSIIPAFRFNLLTIIAGVFLFADGAFSAGVSGVFLLTYAVLVRLFVPVNFGGAFNSGDVILAVFTSGTLFCANFMLQWYGTVPKSIAGRMLYGFIAGILAYILMGCGTSPVEMVYTVLLCNIINLVISIFEDCWYKRSLKKVVCKAVS
jgi:electron transport complex protein RnfD